MYRQAAQDGGVRFYIGFSCIKYSLASILLFYYRNEVLRWQVPQTILLYRRDEVHVSHVPLLYGIMVGYGSESVTTLGSGFLGKIPRARNPRGTRARTKVQLVTACSYPLPGPATPPRPILDSARSGLSKIGLGGLAAAGFSFAGGLYGETFIFLTPTPRPGRPGGTLRLCRRPGQCCC